MAEEQQRRILAVVQDLIFAAKIQAAAKRLGVIVEFVQDGNKLLEQTSSCPTIIIVDLNHAGLNAIDLVGKLQSHAASRDQRIIGYLSHVQQELKREAERVGCDLVLPRSVFSRDLDELLRQHALRV